MKHLNTSKLIALTSAVMLGLVAPTFAGKAVTPKEMPPVEEKSPYTFTFTGAFDSIYLFRGVNILDIATGGGSLVSGDVNVSAHGFTVGAWYAHSEDEGFDGQGYNELDLYASYAHTFGPVTLTGGYIYYHFNSPLDATDPTLRHIQVESDTHEVNVGISTSVIPFITPSLTYYYDFSLYNGGYLELKVAASFPICEKVSIDPYALISYDLGYNHGTDWNHAQAGVSIPYHINKNWTVSGYAAVSVAMDSVQALDSDLGTGGEDYEVFGGGKVTLTF